MLDGIIIIILFVCFKLQFHQSPVLRVDALMSSLWTLLHFDDCAAGYRLKSALSGFTSTGKVFISIF